VCKRIEGNYSPLEQIAVHFYAQQTGKKLGVLNNLLPDTGASVNLMSLKDYMKLDGNPEKLRKIGDVLTATNGLPTTCNGQASFTIKHGSEKVRANFYFTDEYKGTLINITTYKQLKLIQPDFPKQISTRPPSQ